MPIASKRNLSLESQRYLNQCYQNIQELLGFRQGTIVKLIKTMDDVPNLWWPDAWTEEMTREVEWDKEDGRLRVIQRVHGAGVSINASTFNYPFYVLQPVNVDGTPLQIRVPFSPKNKHELSQLYREGKDGQEPEIWIEDEELEGIDFGDPILGLDEMPEPAQVRPVTGRRGQRIPRPVPPQERAERARINQILRDLGNATRRR